MIENTLAVIGICYLEKIELNKVYEKLITFKGAKRRFTETKVLDNIIIDDYAHHPNEIAKELNKADYSYIMDIYKSRESQEDYPNITSDMIINKLEKGKHLKTIDELLIYNDSVLLFMSPNDLKNIEEVYKNKYTVCVE